MKTLALEDAVQELRNLGTDAESEPVLLTRQGRPVACILSLRQYDAEDLNYITDPAFWKMIHERRENNDDCVSLEEIELKLAADERAEQHRPLGK